MGLRGFIAGWVAMAVMSVIGAVNPSVKLFVEPQSIVVTEKAEATIRIMMPQQLRHNPSIGANFIPEGMRLSLDVKQVREGSDVGWQYVVKVPLDGDKVGKRILGPVTVSIPVRTDFFGFVSKTADYRSNEIEFEVTAPPDDGKPDDFCGAIAKKLSVIGKLDTNICTAGDPLIFTLDIAGATDHAMVRAPKLGELLKGSAFKADDASLKTDTLAASKRFIWRVRAVKAGTVEFPAVRVGWYNSATKSYEETSSEAIPIQIRAGAQAVLGALDENGGNTDEFPMPDGLELSGLEKNFTLEHAISLAIAATSEMEFAKAAEKYEEFLATHGGDAKHYRNLGSLYVMAGKQREALDAYRKAEWKTGATEGVTRGIRAAYARLKNDPRADLPLPRMMFPFWFRFALRGRILCAAGALVGIALLFLLAMKAGRKLSVLAVAIGMTMAVEAWPFGGRSLFDDFFNDMPMRNGRRMQAATPIKARAWFGNTRVSVGEPVDLIVVIDTGSVKIDGGLQIGTDLPSSAICSAPTSDGKNLCRMKVVFPVPGTNDVRVTVGGSYSGSYCVTNGNMISSGHVMGQAFQVTTEPAQVVIRELPKDGKPLDFGGAVGSRFKLTQSLKPTAVHPGDLVTATYRLDFDGYFPSNVIPRIDNLSREFKAYDVKEVARNDRYVEWSQILVPKTIQATNSALVSISYYEPKLKCYRKSIARPAPIIFLSAEAASTENTTVMMNENVNGTAGTANDGDVPYQLRFAPRSDSPIICTLPKDSAIRETERYGKWVRVECSRAAGWVKR